MIIQYITLQHNTLQYITLQYMMIQTNMNADDIEQPTKNNNKIIDGYINGIKVKEIIISDCSACHNDCKIVNCLLCNNNCDPTCLGHYVEIYDRNDKSIFHDQTKIVLDT